MNVFANYSGNLSAICSDNCSENILTLISSFASFVYNYIIFG